MRNTALGRRDGNGRQQACSPRVRSVSAHSLAAFELRPIKTGTTHAAIHRYLLKGETMIRVRFARTLAASAVIAAFSAGALAQVNIPAVPDVNLNPNINVNPNVGV